MTTKLKDVRNKTISITCTACQHVVNHEVANLLLVLDDDTTTHAVRQRASCPKCKAVGDNIYSVG